MRENVLVEFFLTIPMDESKHNPDFLDNQYAKIEIRKH